MSSSAMTQYILADISQIMEKELHKDGLPRFQMLSGFSCRSQ